MSNQATRVIARFGGVSSLLRALDMVSVSTGERSRSSRATIYKWSYPRSRGGTGGLIPASALHLVLKAARLEGILLTADDLNPEETR